MDDLKEVHDLFRQRGVTIRGQVRVELPMGSVTGTLLGLDFNYLEGHSAVIDTGGILLKRVHPSRVFSIH